MSTTTRRPGVRSVRSILQNRASFTDARIGLPHKSDSSSPLATVRVAWQRPENGTSPCLLNAAEQGWLRDVGRFLRAEGFAVRYASDHDALLLLDPRAAADGAAAELSSDAALATAPAPVPVPDHNRWDLHFWGPGEEGMLGFGTAADVRAAVAVAADRGHRAVVDGSGAIWIADRQYSPTHSTPPEEVWSPYAVPNGFTSCHPWNSDTLRMAAFALLPYRGNFRAEVFEVPGHSPAIARDVSWPAAVAALQAVLPLEDNRVESSGRGAVRIWHEDGGMSLWTPVPGTEQDSAPGMRYSDTGNELVTSAAAALSAAGHQGAACGDWEPLPGARGFYVVPAGDEAVRVAWAPFRPVGHSPATGPFCEWVRVLVADGWGAHHGQYEVTAYRDH
ncbi:hypothetical protein ABT095_15070 [Kitasatospora sp. NPDC002227]|uniref:hypothetical protein n=1 Tax=Kitasatospora sp. NPDC002227 TaxID=3154773 RepID=UPI00332EDDB8